MNKPFEKIRAIAKRTLDILDLIEAKKTIQQIVEELGVSRQLVEYYLRVYNQDNKGRKSK